MLDPSKVRGLEARDTVSDMTTVTLPDDLAQLMEKEARRRRLSVPELLRDLLSSQPSSEGAEKSQLQTRSISFAGLIDDPGMVPARRLDEALEEGWADAIARDRG